MFTLAMFLIGTVTGAMLMRQLTKYEAKHSKHRHKISRSVYSKDNAAVRKYLLERASI